MQRFFRRFCLLLIVGITLGLGVQQVWAATYSVTITDDSFVPSTLKIKEGDSVTFINSTDATQSAKTTSSSGFNTGNIGAGASKTVSLSTAGSYSYSLVSDSTVKGTITVSESASSSADDDDTSTAKGGTTGDDMPVSGTTDVLLALVFGGLAFLMVGVGSGRFARLQANDDSVVEISPVKAYNEEHGSSASSAHSRSTDHSAE